jgi:hypothetical protein
LASFQLKGLPLGVEPVNADLFYGSAARTDIEHQALETTAVARLDRPCGTGRGTWGPGR